ncbi:ribonuclease H [Senna tora]|uniref:Ribonuclease H n=1 Tax=Senna tora TaxID=362788 RepID=A0A834WFP7_9FABA|nr:ribonuclease H [Senna tora]
MYESPNYRTRRELWGSLQILSNTFSEPWVIVGDFNAFVFNHEKSGGSTNGSHPDEDFKQWIDDGLLVDLGFSGTTFTWNRGSVSIRLDRVIANESWRSLFCEAAVVHLPKYKSDHCPLWLRLNPASNDSARCDRPFRFLAPWVMHEGFSCVVKDAWRDGVNWGDGLNSFYDTVKIWNRKTFGNIFLNKKTHLVAWNNVCKPKVNGGLGLRHLKHQNSAFMCKLGWGLVHQINHLWARMLRAKYHCGNDILSEMKSCGNSSRLWRAVVRNWDHVANGLVWNIGNGLNTRFWSDVWVPGYGKLCDVAVGPVSNNELSASVASYVTPSGDWDWSQFEGRIPNEVSMRIVAISPPSEVHGNNKISWKYTKDGLFSVKTAYHSIMNSSNLEQNKVWSRIWHLHVPQRIRSFLWLCAHNKLLTNEERAKRGMEDQAFYSRCNGRCEDILHAIRDCPKARNVWMRLVNPRHWHVFFNMDLHRRIHLNLHKQFGVEQMDWSVVFSVASWSLWKWRNDELFAIGSNIRGDQYFIIMNRVKSILNDVKDGAGLKLKKPARVNKVVRWTKPEAGNLGSCSILMAEMWGVLSGIELAWQRGSRKLEVEMDSLVVCGMVQGTTVETHPCFPMLNRIHNLLRRDWEVVFRHSYREGNRATDAMASLGHGAGFGLNCFLTPPPSCMPRGKKKKRVVEISPPPVRGRKTRGRAISHSPVRSLTTPSSPESIHSEEAEIAKQNNRNVSDYATPKLDGLQHSIRRPSIQTNSFEIKPATIQLLQANGQFGGSLVEDPKNHILNFLEICDTFKHNGVSDDAIHLMLFPFSLRDKAKVWLQSLLEGLITTWE